MPQTIYWNALCNHCEITTVAECFYEIDILILTKFQCNANRMLYCKVFNNGKLMFANYKISLTFVLKVRIRCAVLFRNVSSEYCRRSIWNSYGFRFHLKSVERRTGVLVLLWKCLIKKSFKSETKKIQIKKIVKCLCKSACKNWRQVSNIKLDCF